MDRLDQMRSTGGSSGGPSAVISSRVTPSTTSTAAPPTRGSSRPRNRRAVRWRRDAPQRISRLSPVSQYTARPDLVLVGRREVERRQGGLRVAVELQLGLACRCHSKVHTRSEPDRIVAAGACGLEAGVRSPAVPSARCRTKVDPVSAQDPSNVPEIDDWNRLLDGKVAVVTGGGDGIGGAVSRLFAEHGALVEIAEIDPERAEQSGPRSRRPAARSRPCRRCHQDSRRRSARRRGARARTAASTC